MVHRSGSTHQYEELFSNDESNSKAKDDLQIAETLKNMTASNQSDEIDTKRQLRTSKRLCSINPDVMIPPKSVETSNSTNTTITSSCPSSTSSCSNNSNSISSSSSSSINNINSSHSSNSSSSSIISNSNKTLIDPLMTFATNLIPLAIKPKSIRNRRYTINDCVHPIEKSVPFADQKTKLQHSSTTDELATANTATKLMKNCGKSVDDFNIKKDHFNCSVSLERLTGIVDTISTKLSPNGDKDELNAANKVLCLYCDRTFTSLKLYAKHVERVHQSKSGRRISARTILSNASATNYPGCSYCNVGKVTCLESEELTQLVRHLIQQHGDKYFACEDCLVRFQTRDLQQRHAVVVHGYTDAKSKKESQRKTSRNVQSTTNPSSSSSSVSSSSSFTSSSSSSASSISLSLSSATSSAVTPLMVQVDFDSTDASDQTNLRNRLRRSTDLKAKSDRSTRKQLLSSEETFLSRLGIGLNRSPRSRKGAKNRRGCSSELFETTRSTRSNKNAKQTLPNSYDANEAAKQISSKADPIVNAFDEDFYESVCQNVKLNLSCHLDGKLDSGPMSPSPLSPVASMPTVRSILVKSPLVTETEIHEATTISAFTAFPTLLTAQQHGGESLLPGKMKKPITKHSWKWKWDCVKKYKYVNEGGKIVKKIKQSTCGMRDLSTLDMWTQLTMRMRHEMAARQDNENVGIGAAAREEKRKLIDQLNKILDTRILPKINVEQSDQSIIKMEAIDGARCNSERNATSSLAVSTAIDSRRDPEFPALMNLIKRERTDTADTTVILSGEWARPRCYICFGCGSLFSTVRLLEEHKTSKHPYVHSTHYEIVGKELIDGNLFRNFYIPSLARQRHTEYNKKQYFNSICSAEDSMDSITSTSMSLTKSDSFDLDSNSRNSKVSVSSMASISDRSYSASADDENANSSSERTLPTNKVCSKCNRQCKGTLDLYRHMLDCSSDYAWILAKKRNNIKYRYFGTKRRRQQRSQSSSARKIVRPKKERCNSDTGASPKSKEPSTPRQRPSDAESIQRMLANLPAKRAVRQIFPNLIPKPNNKNKKLLPNRKKILLKQKTKGNSRGFKIVSTSSTTISSVGTNLALRKRRSVETANAVVRRTRSSLNAVPIAEKPKTSGRKSTETTASASAPSTTSSSYASSTSSSASSKNANITKAKAHNDLGSVFRRRTKAVVTKIANTFRRGQKQRLLRTTTHHSPNTSKNTNSAKLDKNKLKAKSKNTFLRTLSFRRSNRNINKMDQNQTTENVEPKKSASKSTVNPSSTSSPTSSSPKSENKASELSSNEAKLQNNTPESVSDATAANNPSANPSTNDSTNSKSDANKNEAAGEVVDETSKAPETPRLKRKRSIKTIINEMRAKCQNQTNATSQNSEDLKTSDEFKKDELRSPDTPIEIRPTDPAPSKIDAMISITSPSTLITMPLSLQIEPIDEPLNLCISPQKNQSAANSSKDAEERPSTSSALQPPEPPLETISPRRRTRKLTDCIAMLTGKLQEKLGVPFIDQSSALLPILSPSSDQAKSSTEDSAKSKKPAANEQQANETSAIESQSKKDTEQSSTTTTSIASHEKGSASEEKPIEVIETVDNSKLQDNVPEKVVSDQVKSDQVSASTSEPEKAALEKTIQPAKTESTSSQQKPLETVPSEKVVEEPILETKQLRPRKSKDTAPIVQKDSENQSKAEQQPSKQKTVDSAQSIDEKKKKDSNDVPKVDSIEADSKPTSKTELTTETVQAELETPKKNKKTPPKSKANKKQLSDDKDTAKSGQEAELVAETVEPKEPAKTIDDLENVKDIKPTPKSKAKKQTNKQNTKAEKAATIEPSIPDFKLQAVIIEQLPECSTTQTLDIGAIDIENEIKLNIVHKELPVAVKQTDIKTTPKKRASKEAAIQIEPSKSKRARSATAKIITPACSETAIETETKVETETEAVIQIGQSKPKRARSATAKTASASSETATETETKADSETGTNVESIKSKSSRAMRSGKQPIEEPKVLEVAQPDAKKSPKTSKPKESIAIKKETPEKDTNKSRATAKSVNKEPETEKLTNEKTEIEEVSDVKLQDEMPAVEKMGKRKPEKEKVAKEKPEKQKSEKEKLEKEKEKADKNKPEKEKLEKEKLEKEKPPEMEKSEKEKVTKEKPEKTKPIRGKPAKDPPAEERPVAEPLAKEELASDVKPIDKPSKSRPKQTINKKSKTKASTVETNKKVEENEMVVPVAHAKETIESQETRELQVKTAEQIEMADKVESKIKVKSAKQSTDNSAHKSTEKRTETIVEKEPEKSAEQARTSRNKDESLTAKTDKNSKQKAKKVKSNEKSAKNVKNSKLSQDTVKFDNSDDELLPWDPEIGFIQTTDETNKIETKPATPKQTPIEPADGEKETIKSAPKPKKKRMSELAQIIADQLLESFKEVDQSRVDELKKIQDLSHPESEAELISTSLSTTPIPKRKSKKLFENIEPKPTKSDKSSAKQKSETRKKSTEPIESIEMKSTPSSESKPIEETKPTAEEQTKTQVTDDTKSATAKSSKEKKSSKKKSSKKEVKKKVNNDTAGKLQSEKPKNTDNKSVKNVLESKFTDDINKKSLIDSSAANTQRKSIVDKVVEKSLFNETAATASSQPPEKIQSGHGPSGVSDAASSDCSEKSKSNSIFAEVLLSQKNPRTERLSDIIGLADKEALSRVPSIKNVVFPQWQSGIDKPSLTIDKEKMPHPSDSKLNFWSRSSPTGAIDKSDKTKIFGVVKNKARDVFSQITKKKLKKSIKTSIRSSSSSSSSSSCSSGSSSNAPKKPLLRPSILSCNNFRDTVTVKSPTKVAPVATAMNDIFDSLRDPKRHELTAKPALKVDVNVSPPKLDTRRNNKKEKNRGEIDSNPKSPIESDMNIAKIAIALEKSNRKELHHQVAQHLNKTSITGKTVSPLIKSPKKIVASRPETESSPAASSIESAATFVPSLQNDDSQDTIISQIVSKIREKADRTDSDDELCLADVAKGLPKDGTLPVTPSIIPSLDNDDIENDTSALVSNVIKNLEDSEKNVSEEQIAAEANEKRANDEELDDDNDDDDDDTNTEMIDMDLEDNESVYTTFSQSTSITSGGGRKKRRKKSIISSNRKSKRNKERLFASPNVSYLCEICNKSFRNQKGLNNHKQTITHISKLSEQEFLSAKDKQNENKTVDDTNSDEKIKLAAPKEESVATNEKTSIVENSTTPVKIVLPPETHENIQSSVIRSSPVKTNSSNCSPYVSPNHINSSGIEPISSPEHSSRFNGSSKPNLTPTSLNSRLTLSQEERLFYECCSMLKGSDRPTVGLNMPELITKPVTPKCNEQPANIAHAAQSPRSRSSPRPGLPKLDINQFSDISSDSNPAYSCPQVPSSSKTHKVFSLHRAVPSKPISGREKDANIFGARQSNEPPDASASGKFGRSSGSSTYPHDSTIVRNYPDSFSDMGDSFPSSQDASESENYAQTILERSNRFPEAGPKIVHHTPQKGEGSHYMQASLPHENIDFQSFSSRSHSDSPLHSTSSQSSSLSRPRTKAALKGYENLKVSIPTTGLDMQHALERSPNSNGCKLAALADIALGTDVQFDLLEPRTSINNEKPSPRATKSPQKIVAPAKSPTKQSSLFVVSSDSVKLHSIELKSKSFEASFHVSPKSRKRTQSIGKKTGYKDRKKKSRNVTSKTNSAKRSPKAANASKPKDVYDFEESHDSVEDEIIPLTHTRPSKTESHSAIESKSSGTPKKHCDDQEDESSYSDRDDYYNFNSVSGSGTEDQENPVEEDETSDRETSQSSKSTKPANNSQKKCLIMGRIFKNAKKNNEPAPAEIKEKLPSKPIPKNELDEIFDNLKNRSSDTEKQEQNQQPKHPKEESRSPSPAVKARPKTPKSKTVEKKPETKAVTNTNDADDSELVDPTQRKSKKSREVANLEAEWGMSVEQIKGIIGIGMRKAQRRCTANRQNKLVETWSSDEYEEFHTTKDIIALIQEAEMKAQRAKAKSDKQNAEANNAAASSSTSATLATNANKESTETTSKTPSDSKKDKPKDANRKIETEKAIDSIDDATKAKVKKPASEKFHSEDESDFDEHWNKKSKRAKIRNRRRTITSREDLIEKKTKSKTKERPPKKQEPIPKQKNQLQNAPPVEEKKKHHKQPQEHEQQQHEFQHQQKQQNHQQQQHHHHHHQQSPQQKHQHQAMKESDGSRTMSPSKSKTTKDGKPSQRRKRIASEMLYYWSSSSDDEFGRIDADSEIEDEDNSENHLEQHGWIVGDSHKKLVTLLAHAKGKKIEDCGVKESVHKRK